MKLIIGGQAGLCLYKEEQALRVERGREIAPTSMRLLGLILNSIEIAKLDPNHTVTIVYDEDAEVL